MDHLHTRNAFAFWAVIVDMNDKLRWPRGKSRYAQRRDAIAPARVHRVHGLPVLLRLPSYLQVQVEKGMTEKTTQEHVDCDLS